MPAYIPVCGSPLADTVTAGWSDVKLHSTTPFVQESGAGTAPAAGTGEPTDEPAKPAIASTERRRVSPAERNDDPSPRRVGECTRRREGVIAMSLWFARGDPVFGPKPQTTGPKSVSSWREHLGPGLEEPFHP